MYRVALGVAGCGDEFRDVEIRLGRGCRADGHRHIGGAHVRRQSVGLGVHRHGREALLVARADHPERDLSAIRYKDSFDSGHRVSFSKPTTDDE